MNSNELLLDWLEHEIHASKEMIRWLENADSSAKENESFGVALELVAHICSCRHNWLDRMAQGSGYQMDWWPKNCDLQTIKTQLLETLENWRAFLMEKSELDLDHDFEFPVGEQTWAFNIRGQAMQMVGHGFYHRGQVAMILKNIGVEVTDTDYLYWKFPQQPSRWGQIS